MMVAMDMGIMVLQTLNLVAGVAEHRQLVSMVLQIRVVLVAGVLLPL
jgi:hypothetical protein